MLDVSQMDLHELARAYSDGQLDFEQYRCARTQLLDSVTGESTIIVRESTKPMGLCVKPVLAEEDVMPRRSYGPVLTSLLITLAVALILACWLLLE
jgi:hypothetical protein